VGRATGTVSRPASERQSNATAIITVNIGSLNMS
jgi:hypothetical protein